MNSLPEPDFPWPFDAPEFRLAMGLRALAPADWIRPDSDWPDQLATRNDLLDHRRGEVTAYLPEAGAAARELLATLVDHLTAWFPLLYQRSGNDMVNQVSGMRVPLETEPPLVTAGRLVADDLCLMTRTPGGWRLTGAVLCFPNRWRLAEKLGRALPGIHRPVPGYDRRLAVPVDRFFDSLRPDRIVWRTNWSLNDDPSLFQPVETAHAAPNDTITPETAGERLFLRVERQTLRLLPASGAIVFGIRTHQMPIGRLSPAQAADLIGVLRTAPEDTQRYKGLTRTAAAALGFLQARQPDIG